MRSCKNPHRLSVLLRRVVMMAKETRCISLETKGRKGKSVTIVSGLRHNPTTMKEIARILKEACGTGGTVKGGDIELQGDQRERAAKELQKMNYIVV